MTPKFGTSGLRGLVVDLTPDLVAAYVCAFMAACPTGATVRVGWDLRPSSPDIADTVIAAIVAAGGTAIVDGPLPTPALALAAMSAEHSAIMVTGSHIPADRNGLKFYTPHGEITKDDERAILRHVGTPMVAPDTVGLRRDADGVARAAYVARYLDGFGEDALRGLRIGVYQHSSVARDIMMDVVRALGGDAIPLAWSDRFIPVDTEAVDPQTREGLAGWCDQHRLDALISTDGDADRPMVADQSGKIISGDVLGALSAWMLGADTICTPVSSNTMVEMMPAFRSVQRTRIGSPFVIAQMEQVLDADAATRVVGYEANGGFLLGFAADGPAGAIAPLMTRDCLLPMLAPLFLTRSTGQTLADLVHGLPARFTASDRLTGIDPAVSGPFVEHLCAARVARRDFLGGMGVEDDLDLTDGMRVTFQTGEIVHLRPSGNAPEFRCYAEADSREQADDLLQRLLEKTAVKLDRIV